MSAQERFEYVQYLRVRIGSCISTFVRNAASKVTGFASDDNYTGGNVTSNRGPVTFPHCDSRVLHGPQSGCEYCNMHPDWQDLREAWGINFTGEHDPDKIVCPAEQARPLSTINLWGGNLAKFGDAAKRAGDANFALAQLVASEMSPEEIEEAIASLREMRDDLAASAPEVFLEEDPRYRPR